MNLRNKTSGYVETYFLYDFNNPANHYQPTSTYNYNRTNEVNVNLAMIKLLKSGSNTKTIQDCTFRSAGRSINAKGLISTKGSELKNSNFAITSSLSLTL